MQPLPLTSAQFKKESRTYFEMLGKRVTQLRKSRGMTQGEMGRALGVSQQAVFAYETGERRISVLVLQRLARVFRISTDQFLGFVPDPPVGKRRLSPRAMRHAERLQALSKTQQRFLVRILDMLEQQNRSATARPRAGA